MPRVTAPVFSPERSFHAFPCSSLPIWTWLGKLRFFGMRCKASSSARSLRRPREQLVLLSVPQRAVSIPL